MKRYAKFITAAVAFVGVLVSSGLLDGQAQAWASTIIAALGAAGVYVVPNDKASGAHTADAQER